jgi:hypothetical protein
LARPRKGSRQRRGLRHIRLIGGVIGVGRGAVALGLGFVERVLVTLLVAELGRSVVGPLLPLEIERALPLPRLDALDPSASEVEGRPGDADVHSHQYSPPVPVLPV